MTSTVTINDIVQQTLADMTRAEAELWAAAAARVDPHETLTKPERRLAELAFKAGMYAGAQWILDYLPELQRRERTS